MNAGKLERTLNAFGWVQLRTIAKALGLCQKGGKASIAERVMDLHQDPVCAAQVAQIVRQVAREEPGAKRRKVTKPRAAVSLEAAFEAVHLESVAVAAAEAAAAAVESVTLDAADYQDEEDECTSTLLRLPPHLLNLSPIRFFASPPLTA